MRAVGVGLSCRPHTEPLQEGPGSALPWTPACECLDKPQAAGWSPPGGAEEDAGGQRVAAPLVIWIPLPRGQAWLLGWP